MKQKSFDSNIVQRAERSARQARAESNYGQLRLGAAIFTKRKIIATGSNTRKTFPLQQKYNVYRGFEPEPKSNIHAEMQALAKLKRLHLEIDPADLAIFVYRETADGELALAKPCPACERALRDFGITNIYYTGKASKCYEKYIINN